MTEIILPLAAVVLGLCALVWSADVFVDGAAKLARLLGAPALVIGIVVVGFGTSAPEMAVSVVSALRGAANISLGNAYGSNICNIALILGACAAIRPLVVNRNATFFAIPALIVSIVVSLALLADLLPGTGLSRLDSMLLLVFFAVVLISMARSAARSGRAAETADEPQRPDSGRGRALLACGAKTAIGLVFLVLSSRILVWGAVEAARKLGVSELVIGLTIVAVGTSLPELAASIAAVRRGEDDLAVGNIVGSNVFNALAVVGLAGICRPLPVIERAILVRDLPVSLFLAGFLLVVGFPRKGRSDGRLGRASGVFLLCFYVGYLLLLVAAP